MTKANFKLVDLNTTTYNIINSLLSIYTNNKINTYKIIDYLGKGTVGQVYLLKSIDSDSMYTIKISNLNYYQELKDEVIEILRYFNCYNINHIYHPIFYGNFDNLKAYGVIFPFLGFYNLDQIKEINYKITWKNNLSIVKQIIEQLIKLKNIIHGDLKSANVVVNKIENNMLATIIDFGLIKLKSCKSNVFSTNYITSPESLLSLDKYGNCINSLNDIDLTKHDYYGLYSIILDLFLKKNYWNLLTSYLMKNTSIKYEYIFKYNSVDILCYVYYKFFYDNKNDLPNISYQNLINKIELDHINLTEGNFNNFDQFFEKYIMPNINYTVFDYRSLSLFKSFLINIVHFDPKKRKSLNELLAEPFLKYL
jgi:serine/threonine protein kinase